MGTYPTVSLGSMVLGFTKDDIDPGLIRIFRPSDLHTERIDRRNRRKLAEYVGEDFVDEYDVSNPFTSVEYQCTAAAARDRLDLKGFTYEVAVANFERELEASIRQYEGYIRDRYLPTISHVFEERLRVLRTLTVSSWLEGLVRIKAERLTRDSLDGLPGDDSQLPLLRYMLENSRGFYGLPVDDGRHVVRIALETASPQEPLVYDLSDLLAGGRVDEADDLVQVAEDLINEDFLLSHRVIVLTEGDTDRRLLERSLRLLYPHLAEYFHFFDFTGARVGGGVGELAKLVRAFAAADVRHRILALFDNDTAAMAALSRFDPDSLPSNIAVRHYPTLPLARDYPTLGPSGRGRMDVNGLAASLEIYLGEDVLRDDDGMFSPVQWTGYDRGVSAYQGAILDKQRVLDRFSEKLAICEACPDQISHYDWEGIKAILDTMRRAFHRTDTHAILRGAIHE